MHISLKTILHVSYVESWLVIMLNMDFDDSGGLILLLSSMLSSRPTWLRSMSSLKFHKLNLGG